VATASMSAPAPGGEHGNLTVAAARTRIEVVVVPTGIEPVTFRV
jgi:hypothetical protein